MTGELAEWFMALVLKTSGRKPSQVRILYSPQQIMTEKKVRILPWEMSATGSWGPETGIFLLRDEAISQLVEILWEHGIHVQNTALVELIAHGNPRKAAELARGLVQKYPVVEISLRRDFGSVAAYLLETPLEQLPSQPSEYPQGSIEFIQ